MADNFYLDTSNMDSVISQVQNLAAKTEELHADFQTMLTHTTQDWTGKARTTFDKKAHMLMQELTDVTQSLFDMSEELLSASTTYMEADTQLAQATDGKSNRY
ncbi:MAG: WXG100 family type VII secretion target [Clostridiales bacterium]|nr:WXG100 family type VII secretion target [Clostridiales bacterium]MDD6935977.1 WXG100 family type VII secretion target [Clostridiales bacterium]MDY2962258.1 WXG100 family type VII secretion target [Oscillospiraceae bacterium]